jgi:hypothetical protein
MSEYREVLNKFDDYNNYQEEKLRDKALKSDFLNKLKHCSKIRKVTNNNLFIKLNGSRIKYSKEELGEPLLYLKRLTIIRWIFFILAIFLTTLFYVLIFLIIKDIASINDIYSLNTLSNIFAIVIGIYMYFLAVAFSTNFVSLYYTYKNSDNFIKLIKLFPVFFFPFNKFTTDVLAIYFVIGEKGMLVFPENISYHRIYSYTDLLDNKYIYWDINDFLDKDCQEKIFELAKKYYG